MATDDRDDGRAEQALTIDDLLAEASRTEPNEKSPSPAAPAGANEEAPAEMIPPELMLRKNTGGHEK